MELLDVDGRERRLAKALSAGYQFDLIIWLPAFLSMLTINALVAAQSVIVTMQCEYLPWRACCPAQHHSPYRGHGQPKAQIEGILRTMYDQKPLTGEVSKEPQKHFGDLARTVMRNVRLAEALSHGLPALHYDRYSSGARAYAALAGEFGEQNQDVLNEGSPACHKGASPGGLIEHKNNAANWVKTWTCCWAT